MGRKEKRRKSKQKKERARRKRMARSADKYALYQRAVQVPESDVRFLRRVFRQTFGRDPRSLREDFCGTAALCCAWVEAHGSNFAFGVDLDPEPLAWGREHNVGALPEEATKRVELIEGDVRSASHEPVDVTVGFNFSYFLFKTRPALLEYFRKARTTLHDEGLFVLDVFGGADAHKTMEEDTDHEDFVYTWDQDRYDPISMEMLCHIHFGFPDGSRMKRAFTYDWRLWSIRELRELLEEAGFAKSDVYWEGTDTETWEGNGVFSKRERAPDDPAFIAYIVAQP
ncbi:MAG: class I SAM-dependent methyltransferase [Myxococcales bacterium]|nr:class I SAM-dependent methyltransferase [Myxococcales bacterium]